MLCQSYLDLSLMEQREYIGALLHACQTNEACFQAGQNIVEWATRKGVFEGVKILPEGWDNVPPPPDAAPYRDEIPY